MGLLKIIESYLEDQGYQGQKSILMALMFFTAIIALCFINLFKWALLFIFVFLTLLMALRIWNINRKTKSI